MERSKKKDPLAGLNPGAGNIASGFKFDDDCTSFAEQSGRVGGGEAS